MRKRLEYTVIIEKQQGARGYWVKVPSLTGCFSTGDTIDDALSNVKDAIATYLEALREQGQEIPIETKQPIIGRVRVAVEAA